MMRLRAILFAIAAAAGAGAAAFHIAGLATDWIEQTTAARARAGLEAAGEDWAQVTADGLLITLTGAAPNETSRFRALQIVRQTVGTERVGDASTLEAAALAAPPAFALDILRNGTEVSLIGLVPSSAGRAEIGAALRKGSLAEGATDMLEEASDPAPPGWGAALDLGLSIAAEVPRSKVSIAPGRVGVIAVADSEADRATLEARMRRRAPDEVTLDLNISAPRPVIAPFVLTATRGSDGTGRLEVCSAETPEDGALIEDAARAAGLEVTRPCAIGIGSPSADWTKAATEGIAALQALGGGRFALRDRSAEIAPLAEVAPAQVADALQALTRALPGAFTLTTILPVPQPAEGATELSSHGSTRSCNPTGPCVWPDRCATPRPRRLSGVWPPPISATIRWSTRRPSTPRFRQAGRCGFSRGSRRWRMSAVAALRSLRPRLRSMARRSTPARTGGSRASWPTSLAKTPR